MSVNSALTSPVVEAEDVLMDEQRNGETTGEPARGNPAPTVTMPSRGGSDASKWASGEALMAIISTAKLASLRIDSKPQGVRKLR